MRQGGAWLAGADTPTLDREGEAGRAGMGILPLGELFLCRALDARPGDEGFLVSRGRAEAPVG